MRGYLRVPRRLLGRSHALRDRRPPSDWVLEVWALVREAQAASIAACVPGTTAREVEAAERTILETRPDLGEVLPGAGHAIGLAIHEPPFCPKVWDAACARDHLHD